MGGSFMETEAPAVKLREHLAARAEDEGIAAAWLFGSVARGTARPDSDVDVGVLYREDPPRTLAGIGRVFGLEEALAEATGLPIQVVNLNQAPVDLIVRVLRDGKLLVDREPLRRINFEVSSRKEFWDLEPYRSNGEGPDNLGTVKDP
jgi:predicted nucleotidyltransferase